MDISQEKLNCNRKAKIMAFWIGYFEEPSDFWKYIQTQFCAENENTYNPKYNMLKNEFDLTLSKIWKEEYKKRSFENSFRKAFEGSYFNRFQYDFGVTFSEDFLVAHSCKHPTDDIKLFLGEWENDLIEVFNNIFPKGKLPKKYNAFFGIPSCEYTGSVKEVKIDGGIIMFIGNFEEDNFSTEIAEEYNV